ncbi:MAG: carbamoyl phosphate synthetase [Mucilaginibacter sp.]|nr:carbamoyl phosphate synthetase [Mucilaginibacter sp.]
MKTIHLTQTKNHFNEAIKIATAIFLLVAFDLEAAHAQDGNAGINQATSQVKSYFDTGTNLMYAIGAIVGLVGAIKVFKKWNDGEHDTGKVASSWFGSCIFLVIVATVLKSFFGV